MLTYVLSLVRPLPNKQPLILHTKELVFFVFSNPILVGSVHVGSIPLQYARAS
jgi:hypothetical protein